MTSGHPLGKESKNAVGTLKTSGFLLPKFLAGAGPLTFTNF